MREGYLYVGNNVFSTLLAISEQEQQLGLMGVAWPPPIMSFVYSTSRINRFWMKNTPSPLDIVFTHNGEITQICIGEPYSTSAIGDYKQSDLVIEFPLGTVVSSEMKLGNKVGIISPTKDELRKILASGDLRFCDK
jgi:uncharacterized membrane protein (UPF0127 family)